MSSFLRDFVRSIMTYDPQILVGAEPNEKNEMQSRRTGQEKMSPREEGS